VDQGHRVWDALWLVSAGYPLDALLYYRVRTLGKNEVCSKPIRLADRKDALPVKPYRATMPVRRHRYKPMAKKRSTTKVSTKPTSTRPDPSPQILAGVHEWPRLEILSSGTVAKARKTIGINTAACSPTSPATASARL
jgi:hypothetical protein